MEDHRSTKRYNVIGEIVAQMEIEYAAVTRMVAIDKDPQADAQERAEETVIIREAQAQYTGGGALFEQARVLGINRNDIRLLRNRFPLITDYWALES